jgi:ribonuclease T2
MLFIVDSLRSGLPDPFCGFDLSSTLTTMTARRKSENLMGVIKEVDEGCGADPLSAGRLARITSGVDCDATHLEVETLRTPNSGKLAMKKIITAMLLCICLVPGASARKHRRHEAAETQDKAFDYYLLALSWAPSYCASHPRDHSRECSAHPSFVLHGLWPQSENGAPPMDCAEVGSPSTATVEHMLNFMPSRGLIQHEWSKHGTCSGLSADDYFKNVEKAWSSVRVPESYRSLSHEAQVRVSDLEQAFAVENHAASDAFRTSCHDGELVGIEVCLDKNLKYRSCTRSARECAVREVTVRPTQ